MSKHFKSRESHLLEQALVVDESCKWWEDEMVKALFEFEKFEKDPSPNKKEIPKVFEKIEYLLSRVEFEQTNIDRIEKKIQNYLAYKKIILNK